MSDVVDHANTGAETSDLSAGAMLRRAREAAGLHVGALAVMMKIPVKKLEALESDQFDQLPDAVFVRALASSMCRTLHIDPVPILQKLPSNRVPKLQSDERGLNAPFRGAGEHRSFAVQHLLTSPPAVIVALLLLGALVVYLVPDLRFREAPVTEPVIVAAPAESESVSAPIVAASGGPMPVMPASPERVEHSAAPAALASNTVVPLPPAVLRAASAPVVPPSQAAGVVPSLSTDGALVFKARGSTWVKVVDAKSNVLLSKTLNAGDQVGVSGAMPLAVVIGRSDLTDVLVHGQPFAVQDVSKDNVARFEVK